MTKRSVTTDLAHEAFSDSARAWLGLPRNAQLYVLTVSACGISALLFALTRIDPGQATLLTLLVIVSIISSSVKIELPVQRSVSTLTVGYIIDYAALLIMGTDAAVITAAAGAWSQCKFRSRFRNPIHQTLFSAAALALAARVAGAAYAALNGGPSLGGIEALIGAAMAFFVVNSALVAGAIALSNGQSIERVWAENFTWSWLGYVVGAAVAAAAAAGVERSALWLLPFIAVPLVLTYQNLSTYVRRLSEVTTDPLTGLSNVRFLHTHGDESLRNAERLGTTVRVYVIDLDGFKAVNDRFGHQQGNIVLKDVASALSRLAGPRGMCVRFGGDEFVALVPGQTPAASARFIHGLHVAVEAIVCGAGANRARLGASIGSAEFPGDGRTIDGLLAAADARMYRNKAERQRSRSSVSRERIPA